MTREFSQADWDTYSGCERWQNGNPPLIRVVGYYVAIADARGIAVYDYSTNPEEVQELNWPLPNQKLAHLLLEVLPLAFPLENYGFTRR